MVQHSILQPRRGSQVEVIKRLAGLQQAQEMKYTVQHTDILVGGYYGGAMPIDADTADQVAFVASGMQVQMQRCNHGR